MTQISHESKPKKELAIKRRWRLKAVFTTLGRWCMELASISLTLLIVWAGALAFLMTRQSVDLGFFKPHYEQWFSEAFSGKTTSIENYRAKWIQKRQSIEITAKNISISGEQGAVQDIGEVRGEFIINPFLLTTQLTRLSIDGGALTVSRNQQGVVQVGLGKPDTFERVGALWTLQGDPQPNKNMDSLERIRVKSAYIFIRDEQNDFALNVQDVDGKLLFDGENIAVTSEGNIISAGALAPYFLNIKTTYDRARLSVQFDVENVSPQAIAPKKGRFAGVSNLDAPVKLGVEIQVLPKTGIRNLNIHLNVRAGRLKTGTTYKPFTAAEIIASYNADTENIDLQKLYIESEALNLQGHGIFDDLGDMSTGFLKKPIHFTLNLEPVRINPGLKYDGPIFIKSGLVRGALDIRAQQLDLSKIALNFGGFQTELAAKLSFGEEERLKALKLDGLITGTVTGPQLLGLWPYDLVPGTRDWMVKSFKAGELSNLKIRLDLDEADIRTKRIANDHLRVSYDVNNADIRYLSKMPWLRGMSGYGILQGNQFEHHVLGGKVDGLTVGKGLISMPRLSPKGGDLILDFDLSGSVTEMLRLSNFPPFGYADKYRLTPADFDGAGLLNLRVVRPLLNHYDLDDIQYTLKGSFSGVGMPVGYGAYQFNDGTLSFFVDRNVVKISGPVKIGNWQADLEWVKAFTAEGSPARYSLRGQAGRDDLDDFGIGLRKHFGGEVDLTFQGVTDSLLVQSASILADFTNAEVNIGSLWDKPMGSQGHLKGKLLLGGASGYRLNDFTLKSEGLFVTGSIALAKDFKLSSLDISKVYIDGFVDAAVKMKPTKDGVLSLFLTGKYLNVEQWVSKAFRTQSSVVSAPILMTAAVDTMTMNENYVLQSASAVFSHNGQSVRHARLKGSIAEGQFFAEITEDTQQKNRVVRVEIPNASYAALSFLGLNSIRGGQLKIDGILPKSGADGGLAGSATLTDFTLVRAPAFAQILSIASLQGLSSTLSGSGLKFTKLEMDFMLKDGVFKIRDGRASGAALGITGEGNIDVPNKIVDFNGVLVPSYTVNSVLGDIPVLGDIMVGKKGEGMFALNYMVKGPFSATRVSVNPLSALTPGFLRRIFDIKREKITDPKLKELIESQKQ